MNAMKVVVIVLFVLMTLPQSLCADMGADDNREPVTSVQEKALTVVDEVIAVTEDAMAPAVEIEGNSSNTIIDAVKAELKSRSKTSGKLDVYDSKIDKVRNLDLITLKEDVTKDGDTQIVQGDFRDMTSGDVVTLDINVIDNKGAYEVKEMTVVNVVAPEAAKVEKTDYSDQEFQEFMKEYVTIQSQGTGTFDLYDEKIQKMRNLEFVKLDEKLRRYGIIAISTAEFKDKNSNDKVFADINLENKNGLSVTAVRIKSVARAVKE